MCTTHECVDQQGSECTGPSSTVFKIIAQTCLKSFGRRCNVKVLKRSSVLPVRNTDIVVNIQHARATDRFIMFNPVTQWPY